MTKSDSTTMIIEPFVARDIIINPHHYVRMIIDCSDHLSKMQCSTSIQDHQSDIEVARLFSIILEPSWLQCVAKA